jgi:hypothetical protein
MSRDSGVPSKDLIILITEGFNPIFIRNIAVKFVAKFQNQVSTEIHIDSPTIKAYKGHTDELEEFKDSGISFRFYLAQRNSKWMSQLY